MRKIKPLKDNYENKWQTKTIKRKNFIADDKLSFITLAIYNKKNVPILILEKKEQNLID